MDKKRIYILAAVLLLLAVIGILTIVLVSGKNGSPEEPPELPNMPTSAAPIMSPAGTSAPADILPEAETEPTEAPTITPPAERAEYEASGSDIHLLPQAPTSDSDLIETA